MENQKRNTVLYILIITLFVLVLALGGYIVYDKIQNNSNSNMTNSNESNDLIFVSKMDNSKDWVYDAEYEKNVIADSYSTAFDNIYYSKDIVVPYINIKSSYADVSNGEIKNVFDDAIKTYNNGVNDKIIFVAECGYENYINNDSLSVILTYGVGGTDIVYPKYYTYNIDLKTGKQLSYEEAYNVAGFNSSNINSKVESAITNTMKEKMENYTPENYPNGTNFDTYSNESINNYRNSISNNTLKYFLDDNGKLNVIVKLNIPEGNGEFDTIIIID